MTNNPSSSNHEANQPELEIVTEQVRLHSQGDIDNNLDLDQLKTQDPGTNDYSLIEKLSPAKTSGEIKINFDFQKGKYKISKEELTKWPQFLKDDYAHINGVFISLAKIFREMNKGFRTKMATFDCGCMTFAELLMIFALFTGVIGINMIVNAGLCATVGCGRSVRYGIIGGVFIALAILAVGIGSSSLLSNKLRYNPRISEYVAKTLQKEEYQRRIDTKKGEVKYSFRLLKDSYNLNLLWKLTPLPEHPNN